MVLSARRFSRAWANVSLASADWEDSPLYRAIHIEVFADGVRLVATNGYLLLRSWVPENIDEDGDPVEPEPDPDLVPDETVTVLDTDGRASNLFKYLRAVTKKNDDPDEDLRLWVKPRSADEDGGQLNLGGNLAGEIAVFAIDLEQVALPTFDGPFFEWRRGELPTKPSETNSAGIGPDNLARLGKITGVSGIVFDFSDARTVRLHGDPLAHCPTIDGAFARYKPETQ